MKRIRISPFQVALLRVIRTCQEQDGVCCPTSPNSKLALFGRRHCASTAERVTLFRSLRRLVANGMITEGGKFGGFYRLTEKGVAWLEAAGQVAPKLGE